MLLFCVPARAAFEFGDAGWEGASELLAIARAELGRERVQPIATIDWSRLGPKDALLVLHPERELEYRETAAFLSAGGRLALLDDYGRSDALLEKFRIHRIRAPLRPRDPLRGNPDLAIALPSPQGSNAPDGPLHPIVAGVDRVITNHPTALRTEAGIQLTPVLHIEAEDEPDALLAVIGVIGNAARCGLADGARPSNSHPLQHCGRLLAMGDPSVVINLMLRYPGNRAFAEGLIAYLLADDSWGPRGGTLYLVAGEFSQKGLYGGVSGLRRALRDRLDELEDFVQEARRNGLPDPLAFGLAAVCALGAALWVGRASTRLYHRPSPKYALATPLVAQGGAAGRAAVLAAPTTHPALAALELKAALEEGLREALGLPRAASVERILPEIRKQNALPSEMVADLAKLMARMAQIEQAVTTSQSVRLSADSVTTMHRRVTRILGHVGVFPGVSS